MSLNATLHVICKVVGLSLGALLLAGAPRVQAQWQKICDADLGCRWCNGESCHSYCNPYEDWSGAHWQGCNYDGYRVEGTACSVTYCTSLDNDFCVTSTFSDETCTTDDGREGKPTCQYIASTVDPAAWGEMLYECKPARPLLTTGNGAPKFMIVTVVYAPPGSKTMAGTQVTYGSGSKIGTTVSAGRSFKEGTKLSASVTAGQLGNSGTFEASTSNSRTESSSSSVSISKAASTTLTVPAPSVDGIDHTFDQIWVVLSPELEIEVAQPAGCESCSQEDSVTWRLLPERGTTISILVGEITGALAMHESTAAALQNHNITSDDMQTILNANPLALRTGDSTEEPDSQRFKRTGMTFPFIPPPPPGNPNMQTYQMVTDASGTETEGAVYEYSTSLSLSGSAGFSEIVSAKFSFENSWTWTSTLSEEQSSSSNTQAMVTIGTPSQEYRGPAAIGVYLDTVYGTYAFVGAN